MRKAALFLAAAITFGCASSDWAKVESVPGGKLYVPKLYAPLLPGSVYPNKRVSVPAKGRPAIRLVCPEKGDCRKEEILDQAAQRGMVVFVTKEPGAVVPPRGEIDSARVGTLIVAAASLKVEVSQSATAPAFSSSLSKKSSVLLATLQPPEPFTTDDGTILKLYSPNEKGLLPKEAFRDAVEWLAGELGAR